MQAQFTVEKLITLTKFNPNKYFTWVQLMESSLVLY